MATEVKVATPVKKVTLLATGKSYPFTWDAESGKLVISGLPALPPDPLCSVIKVEFESIPCRAEEKDMAAWLKL